MAARQVGRKYAGPSYKGTQETAEKAPSDLFIKNQATVAKELKTVSLQFVETEIPKMAKNRTLREVFA